MTNPRSAALPLVCALGLSLARMASAAEPAAGLPPAVPVPVAAVSASPPSISTNLPVPFVLGALPLREKPASFRPAAPAPTVAGRPAGAAGGAATPAAATEVELAPSSPATPGSGGTSFPSESKETAASFELGDRLLISLSPRQQREVLDFAESLPRFRADPAEDGFLRRAEAVVFPAFAEYRIGKVSVGGGLITAIRRRNPFALLNPAFLGVSW